MSDNTQKDLEVILCDMCTEDRKPARKTCMKCEISMCVQHLQAHLTTPVLLQTHPLTEPMALCGTTKCPQHGKLLEYYCLDDMTCVCVSCAIEDQHRLHNMKTFSTAHKELMEKLKTDQNVLLMKTDDENVSLEKWEKSEREKLGRTSARVLEAVTYLRDVSLTSVQSSVSARMVAIKTSKRSIQAAQNEKDTFRFLQMYAEVHQDVEKAKAVDLSKGLEPGSDRDKLVLEIRQKGERLMEQGSQFWRSLLTLVDPENHQELFVTGSDLIFDPQIFGPGMSLSKDSRKVFYNSWMGECAAVLVLRSTQSVPNFQRWLVRLSKESDWTVGLCDKQSAKNLRDGPVFGLCCKDDKLCCLITEPDDGSDPSSATMGLNFPQAKTLYKVFTKTITGQGGAGDAKPELVEVFWNFVASSLSFFRRTGQYQREEIFSINMSLNSWDLVPFVRLGKENSQTSSNMSHYQWKCSCGNVYNTQNYSHQTKCSCGEIIGSRRNTEKVCELH